MKGWITFAVPASIIVDLLLQKKFNKAIPMRWGTSVNLIFND